MCSSSTSMHSFLEENAPPLMDCNSLPVYRSKSLTSFSEIDVIQLSDLMNEDIKSWIQQCQKTAEQDAIVLDKVGTTACKAAQLLKDLIHHPYLLKHVQTSVKQLPERCCQLCFFCATPIKNDIDVVFTNKMTQQALVVSAFSFHLLRDHEYCGDLNSEDRVDPSQLIQVLELGETRTKRAIAAKQPNYKQMSETVSLLHRPSLTACSENWFWKVRIRESEAEQTSEETVMKLAEKLASIAKTAEKLCRLSSVKF